MRMRILLGLWIVSLLVSHAAAQLPDPSLDSIFPPGGQAGTNVAVQVAGRDLDEASTLVFSHPGLQGVVETRAAGEFESGPQLVPNQFRVSIPANVAPGVYEVRAVGRFGVSSPRAFVVGRGPEQVDSTDNHQPETATLLPLDGVANGRVEAGAVDYYKISARAGQPLVIACAAQQIESVLQPVVTIWNANRKQLSRSSQTLDPVLAFTPPADGDYFVGVHDRTFGGGATHAYRLRVLTGPYVAAIDPISAPPGTRQTFTLHGLNLPGDAKASPWKIGDTALQQTSVTLYVPAREEDAPQPATLQPAMADADGFLWDDISGGSTASGVPVAYAEYPVVQETEPNQSPDASQRVSLPAEVSGRFFPRRDQDWVVFAARQGERVQVRIISHRLGLPTDPEIFIQRVTKDANGQIQLTQVSTDDDFRAGDQRYKQTLRRGLDLGHRDPSVSFTADQDADYRVGIRDLGGSSLDDPRLAWRMIIEVPRPDYRLTAWTQRQAVDDDKKIEQSGWSIRPGGNLPVLLEVNRRGGMDSPVTITAENLPPGVTAAPCVVAAGQTEGTLLLSAAREAAADTREIRIVGSALVNGSEVREVAEGATLTGATGNVEASRPAARAMQNLVLSVAALDPAIARIDLGNAEDPRAVFRTSVGGKLAVPVRYSRFGTVKGELVLAPLGIPAEVKAGNVTLAADAAGGQLDLNLDSAKIVPGVYAIWMRGKVPTSYARNPQLIEQLTAQRKAMDELQAQLATQVQQADSQLAEAQKASAGQAEQLARVQEAQATLQRSFQTATEQLAQTRQQLAGLQQLASQSGQAEVQQAVQAAEAATQTLVDQVNAVRPSVEAVAAKLAAYQSGIQAAQQTVAQAEQRKKELTDKSQRATEFTKALDARLTEANTNQGPKDVIVYVDSTPVTLEIVATPLAVTVPNIDVRMKAGQEQAIDVQVQRLFGFADSVTMEWELPAGVSDLKGDAVTMAADQSQAGMKLVAGPQATPGRHTLQLKMSLKFNGVDLQHRVPVVVEVTP